MLLYGYVRANPAAWLDPWGLARDYGPVQHHWIVQAALERLRDKCFGDFLPGLIGYGMDDVEKLIHNIVSDLTQEQHDYIHYGLETKYNKQIYEAIDNATDCCDALKRL